MKQILILAIVYLILIKKLTNCKYLDESSSRKDRKVGPRSLDELLQAGAKIAYIESYDDGSDGGNKRGYYKESEDKGSDGYKHFDSFHKKDSDKYGYEAHSAFGKGTGSEKEAKGLNYKYDDEQNEKADGQFKIKQVEEKEIKNAYKVVDDEGDGNDYVRGNAFGYKEKESEDEGYSLYSVDDSEHYEPKNDEEGATGKGNYESEGNLKQDEGNSAYTYDGENNAHFEHYTNSDY
ncbi:hypothetical protein FQA39_LY14106 [Lamprigera yunnana]|nr:hypothetical protein FQA39_LY14106 [Lamprigera yunnana]